MCLHLPRIEARRATYSIAGPWYCPKCPGIGAIGEKRVEFSLPQGRRPNSSGNYQFPADLVGLMPDHAFLHIASASAAYLSVQFDPDQIP